MGSECQASPTSYPWGGEPETLELPSSRDLEYLLSSLCRASEHLALKHHFNSLGSLLDIHAQFKSRTGSNLQEVWKSFSAPYSADARRLSCVGLALLLRDLVVREHPQWQNCLCLGVSNEWTHRAAPPGAFWAQSAAPAYPLQCREHTLLFVRLALDSGRRRAAVLLDPGRCIGQPLVLTEDGLPPQSPPLTFRRPLRNKEHSVGWGSWDYARWTVKTSRPGKPHSEVQLRVYLGRRFQGWPYLEWHNLLFPFRALMTLTPRQGMGVCLRLEVGGDCATLFLLNNSEGRPVEIQVPFGKSGRDPEQKSAMAALGQATGHLEGDLEELLERLGGVCSDDAFVTQLLKIWDEEKRKTQSSFEPLLHSDAHKDSR